MGYNQSDIAMYGQIVDNDCSAMKHSLLGDNFTLTLRLITYTGISSSVHSAIYRDSWENIMEHRVVGLKILCYFVKKPQAL